MKTCRGTILTLTVAAAMCVAAAPLRSDDGRPALPKIELVKEVIKRHFASDPDYQTGDLISRSQVEEALDQLKRRGWIVRDRASIVSDVLTDRNLLVEKLRSKKGRKFMRRAAKKPDAFDRLDRLARLKDGPRILNQLIDGPDGDKFTEYLVSAGGGGTEFAKLAGRPTQSKSFKKPTGRIYTEKQFFDRLKESHAADRKDRERKRREKAERAGQARSASK